MLTHVVRIVNSGDVAGQGGASANEVQIRLAPTRTRIVELSVETPRTVIASVIAPVILWLAWDPDLGNGEETSVALKYLGEEPLVEEVTLSADPRWKSQVSPRSVEGGTLDSKTALLQAKIEQQRKALHTASDNWVERYRRTAEARIAAIPDEATRRHSHFFLEFDLATHTKFLREDSPRSRMVEGAGRYLQQRLLNRISRAQLPDAISRRAVCSLASLQLGIICEHYTTPEDFLDGFILFSTGLLYTDSGAKWNGKPDSAYFFLFAEFAILALQEKQFALEWRALLAAFVACEPLYMEVFAPQMQSATGRTRLPEAERTFEDWRSRRPARPPDLSALINAVRARHEVMKQWTTEDLAALHAYHALQAFPRGSTQLVGRLSHPLPPQRRGADVMVNRELGDILTACAVSMEEHMGENREEPEDKARWVVLDMASLIEPNVRFDAPQASDLRPCSDSTGHDHVVGPVSLVYDVTNEKGWDGTPATKIVIENKTMTVIGERRDERVLDRETYDFFVIAVPK